MKQNKFLTLAVASSILLAVSCTTEDSFMNEELSIVETKTEINFVPNEVLIKFKDGNQSATKSSTNALSLINGEIIESISTKAMKFSNQTKSGNKGELLLVRSKMSTQDAINKLQGLDDIEYAEPNFIYNHNASSNDDYYTNGSLWGMYGDASSPANQYGSQAAEAWAGGNTGSSSVYVGIIDEGYMYTHEDLAGNAGTNPGEVAGNGLDDDGNGLVDDVYGWDFDKNNNSVFDGVDDDHGSHVAGTIGGVGGNGIGVAGVSWDVSLLSAKFLGKRGGTTANAIKAVDYFTDLKQSQNLNIVATNNSWGGGGYSQGLYDAIERANQAGNTIYCSCGQFNKRQ